MAKMQLILLLLQFVSIFRFSSQQISFPGSVLRQTTYEELRLNRVISQCCSAIADSNKLLSCILNENSAVKVPANISLVSYYTPNIEEYAAYSFAINSVYALHNGYKLNLFSPKSGHEFEKRDQRWNKVMIILDLMSQQSGVKEGHYLVWLDTDLVVVDLGMKIDKIIEDINNPDVQLILSRDPFPEEVYSVANTGFMIVKVSDWSRNFFFDWWNFEDRSLGWDQHVFTKLLETKYKNDVSKYVLLLPPDALNTNRPATLNHLPHNQVLHMVGGITRHRKTVFYEGFQEICVSITSGRDVKSQLGLTRHTLHRIEKDVLISRGDLIEELLNTLQKYDYITDREALLGQNLFKIQKQVEEIMLLGDPRRGTAEEVANIHILLQKVLRILLLFSDASTPVDVLQWTLETAFELAISLGAEELLFIMDSVGPTIEYLLKKVSTNDKGNALYYSFKQKEFMANALHLLGRFEPQLELLLQAKEVWLEMTKLNWYGSGAGIINPYAEGAEVQHNIAVLLCMQHRYEEGLQAGHQAISLYTKRWSDMAVCNYENQCGIYAAPFDTQAAVATIYRNMGICAESYEKYRESHVFFELAYNIWYQRLKILSENRSKSPNNEEEMKSIKQELVSLAKRQQEVQFLYAVDKELDKEITVKDELARDSFEELSTVQIEGEVSSNNATRKQWKRKKNKSNQQ